MMALGALAVPVSGEPGAREVRLLGSARAEAGWLGAGAFLVSAGLLAAYHLLGEVAVLALYVGFNALLNLPHQYCTWVRAFRDPVDPAAPRRFAWVMLGILALLVAVQLSPGEEARALVLVNALPYWGLWHLVAQHYGLCALYRRKGGEGATRADRHFLLALFGLGLLRAHAATDLTFRVAGESTALWRLPLPPAWAGPVAWVCLGLYAAVCLAWLVPAWRHNPARARFQAWVALSTFLAFFACDNPMVTTAALTALHNVHYIGLVRRFQAGRAHPLGARDVVLMGLYSLAVHAAFLLWPRAGETLLATLVATHYAADGTLWRLRREPALRQGLGVGA